MKNGEGYSGSGLTSEEKGNTINGLFDGPIYYRYIGEEFSETSESFNNGLADATYIGEKD